MSGIGATYLRILLSRWRLVATLVLGCTVFAWAFSVFVLAQKPKFEAAARLNIVPTSEELGYASRFVRGSTFDGGSVLLGTYAEFAHTRPVVDPIVARYVAAQATAAGQSEADWTAANSVPSPFSPGRILAILNYGAAPTVPLKDEIAEDLIEHTRIETVEGTYLVRLTVEWEDAEGAAFFANALADAIIARAERMSRTAGREIAGSLEARLAARQAELAATLRQARALKAAIGVVDLDRQKQSLLEARLTEQAQLTTDRANLDASESQVAQLRRQAGGKYSAAQQVLESTLAVEAPRAAGLRRSVDIRQGRIAQLDRQIAGLGRNEDRIKQLDDRAAALQAEVTALTERVSFSQTENLANAPRIQLIERALPPLTRSSPKIFFNTVLGFIAGCALAACALLLLGPAKPTASPEGDERDLLPPSPGRAPAEPTSPAARPSAELFTMRPPNVTAIRPGAAGERSGRPILLRGSAALAMVERDEAPAPATFACAPLPRPIAARGYTVAEANRLVPALAPALGPAIADATPLYIAAAGPEPDAQQLYQLLYAHLTAAGIATRTLDGTRAQRDFAAGPPKPLVYLGALPARADWLEAMPADAVLLVAQRGEGAGMPAPPRPGIAVHVVPLAG